MAGSEGSLSFAKRHIEDAAQDAPDVDSSAFDPSATSTHRAMATAQDSFALLATLPLVVNTPSERPLDVLILTPSKIFRFLDLPAELRIQVYHHFFATLKKRIVWRIYRRHSSFRGLSSGQHGVPFSIDEREARPGVIHRATDINTLLLNKKIYQEAVPIAFEYQTFDFRDAVIIQPFFKALGSLAKHLTHIELGLGCNIGHQDLIDLTSMEQLRSVSVSHSIVCSVSKYVESPFTRIDPNIERDDPNTAPAEFVETLVPLLRRLCENRRNGPLDTKKPTFEITEVTWDMCHRCKEGKETQCIRKGSICPFACGAALEGHCVELLDRVRGALTARLGSLEVELDAEDEHEETTLIVEMKHSGVKGRGVEFALALPGH